jgi:hypothetical protein
MPDPQRHTTSRIICTTYFCSRISSRILVSGTTGTGPERQRRQATAADKSPPTNADGLPNWVKYTIKLRHQNLLKYRKYKQLAKLAQNCLHSDKITNPTRHKKHRTTQQIFGLLERPNLFASNTLP